MVVAGFLHEQVTVVSGAEVEEEVGGGGGAGADAGGGEGSEGAIGGDDAGGAAETDGLVECVGDGAGVGEAGAEQREEDGGEKAKAAGAGLHGWSSLGMSESLCRHRL
jgi:hypothetical protein